MPLVLFFLDTGSSRSYGRSPPRLSEKLGILLLVGHALAVVQPLGLSLTAALFWVFPWIDFPKRRELGGDFVGGRIEEEEEESFDSLEFY